jgi:tetratricopeptide (TPR) repeat protein
MHVVPFRPKLLQFYAVRIWLTRVVRVALALICLSIPLYSLKMARADWLRRHPNQSGVTEAIGLDPANSYAYTLQAELAERHGLSSDAERQWMEALRRSPRNAEAWIRLALVAEHRGSAAQAEAHLLEAARISHTWLPRWALANFYLRHNQISEFRQWGRESLLRASEDVTGLFPLFDEAGLTSEVVLKDMMPRNRHVLTAWLLYRCRAAQSIGLFDAAVALAFQIPTGPSAWPGLDDTVRWKAKNNPAEDPEVAALLTCTDRLREQGELEKAERLWNLLCSRGILVSDPWSDAGPVVNSRFRYAVQRAGFDWRIDDQPGVRIVTEGGLQVRLDGSQAEQIKSLVYQPVIVPAGRAYRFAVESRSSDLSEANGLRWEVHDAGKVAGTIPVDASADWKRATLWLPGRAQARPVQIGLSYTRLLGTVRVEGSVEFRQVALEAAP